MRSMWHVVAAARAREHSSSAPLSKVRRAAIFSRAVGRPRGRVGGRVAVAANRAGVGHVAEARRKVVGEARTSGAATAARGSAIRRQ